MIPKELFKKIRKIEITTSRLVTDVFAGQYHSIFKGRGMEFEEVREYLPGDEIRSIDWNVTARMGRPFVKKFVEERELTVMILLDISSSLSFGSRGHLKNDLAAEICSVLSLAAIKNNDKVGFLSFSDKVEQFLPARKGLKHVLRIIREALVAPNSHNMNRATNISLALEFVAKVVKRRAVVFVISDFADYEDESCFKFRFKKPLILANRRSDIIALSLTDPRELELPNVGLLPLEDAETRRHRVVDTASELVRLQYHQRARMRLEALKTLFQSAGVDWINLKTNASYIDEFVKFFHKREQRFR